ncbi:hypothetical protein [Salmonella enterica]|uniref:hypothetical protein n=1 Tax=Salmonella enterica TaxID=28901 RepID=UPI00398C2A1B
MMFYFFKAEDDIRNRTPSRGLTHVTKRQLPKAPDTKRNAYREVRHAKGRQHADKIEDQRGTLERREEEGNQEEKERRREKREEEGGKKKEEGKGEEREGVRENKHGDREDR